MLYVCLLSVLISSVAIAIQDFKSRTVYWWWFLFLYVSSAGFIKYFYNHFFSAPDFLVNVSLSLFAISLTSLYYLVRYGIIGLNRIKCSIGLGDLFMLPVLMFCFSPLNFVSFLILSFLIALTGHTVSLILKYREQTIPLAGYWSLMLIPGMLLTERGLFDIRNDNWILLWLMN